VIIFFEKHEEFEEKMEKKTKKMKSGCPFKHGCSTWV